MEQHRPNSRVLREAAITEQILDLFLQAFYGRCRGECKWSAHSFWSAIRKVISAETPFGATIRQHYSMARGGTGVCECFSGLVDKLPVIAIRENKPRKYTDDMSPSL